MIALNVETYNSGYYIPDTGFEFLLQNGIGIIVLLIALMFLIYQNGKNLYKNTQKYLKRERESKYHNYYMFAVCKSVICFFNILSLFTLIFHIVNSDIGEFHTDILNSVIIICVLSAPKIQQSIITLLYTLTIVFDLLNIRSKPKRGT